MNDLPNDWVLARLGDVCLPVTKVDPVVTGRQSIRYVDIGSVDGTRHELTEVPTVDAASAPSRARQVVRAGDTVFSTVRPYLEKIAHIGPGLEGEFASTGFCVLRPGPRVERRWLFHFATSRGLLDQVLPYQRGVSYPAVLNKDVLAATIPLPPLEEQGRIVDSLDDHLSRLDAATALAAYARRRGVALVRRLLLDAALGHGLEGPNAELPSLNDLDLGGPRSPAAPLPSGWRWLKWRDVGTSQNGRLFPSSDYQVEGIRLLRPGNLRADGLLDWKPSATRCLPEQYAERYPGLLLRPDNLVMNLTAQSLKDDFLGRVCLVRGGDTALLNQRLARLVPSEVSPAFAMVVFRSPLFRRYVSSLNSGSLIQHMFTKQLDEFWLPVPPAAEQERVVQRLEIQLEAWSAMSHALDQLGPRVEGARRSLLAAAFSGRLNAHRAILEGSDV